MAVGGIVKKDFCLEWETLEHVCVIKGIKQALLTTSIYFFQNEVLLMCSKTYQNHVIMKKKNGNVIMMPSLS